MRETPRAYDRYRHFKGLEYQVLNVAIHSETREEYVVYQALYGEFKVYVRPLDMFMSEVDHIKYPDIKERYRFEKLESCNTLEEANAKTATEEANVKTATEEASVKTVAEEANVKTVAEEANVKTATEEVYKVHPVILEFLDAQTVAEKKNIFNFNREILTDDMIDTMAVVLDVSIEAGDIEDRKISLKNCLETMGKYEVDRSEYRK